MHVTYVFCQIFIAARVKILFVLLLDVHAHYHTPGIIASRDLGESAWHVVLWTVNGQVGGYGLLARTEPNGRHREQEPDELYVQFMVHAKIG